MDAVNKCQSSVRAKCLDDGPHLIIVMASIVTACTGACMVDAPRKKIIKCVSFLIWVTISHVRSRLYSIRPMEGVSSVRGSIFTEILLFLSSYSAEGKR